MSWKSHYPFLVSLVTAIMTIGIPLWGQGDEAPPLKPKKAHEVVSRLAATQGSLSKEAIRETVRGAIHELRGCYQKSPDSKKADDCICRVIEKAKFPPNSEGGVVIVTYPLPGHCPGGCVTRFTVNAKGKVTECETRTDPALSVK